MKTFLVLFGLLAFFQLGESIICYEWGHEGYDTAPKRKLCKPRLYCERREGYGQSGSTVYGCATPSGGVQVENCKDIEGTCYCYSDLCNAPPEESFDLPPPAPYPTPVAPEPPGPAPPGFERCTAIRSNRGEPIRSTWRFYFESLKDYPSGATMKLYFNKEFEGTLRVRDDYYVDKKVNCQTRQSTSCPDAASCTICSFKVNNIKKGQTVDMDMDIEYAGRDQNAAIYAAKFKGHPLDYCRQSDLIG